MQPYQLRIFCWLIVFIIVVIGGLVIPIPSYISVLLENITAKWFLAAILSGVVVLAGVAVTEFVVAPSVELALTRGMRYVIVMTAAVALPQLWCWPNLSALDLEPFKKLHIDFAPAECERGDVVTVVIAGFVALVALLAIYTIYGLLRPAGQNGGSRAPAPEAAI